MNCELCGSGIRGDPQAVNIDGGIFRVCNSCSRLGTPARVPGRPNHSTTSFSRSSGYGGSGFPRQSTQSPPQRNTPRSSSPSFEEPEMELTNEYSRLIKSARELRGLSQEELGKKINEKTSVISHLETGSMKPDDALARKLEHFLKIQLFVPSEEIDGGQGETG